MNDARSSRAPGCVSMLGGPLLALGLWLIAQALLLPREAETVRLSIITGALVAGTGAWLLAKRLRAAFPRRTREPRWNETVIDDTAPTNRPAGAVGPDGKPARGDLGPMEALAGGLGCSIVVLAFLLVGPVFLYFYFSGTPTRRGNPVMPLVAGILFSGLGLFGLWALVSSRRGNASREKAKDPRRLP
jgi:ABC-type nickel/cobalt efflux system permease component RcnA